LVPFASGGVPDIVASPTIAPMALFGEAGPEATMPLRRGSDGKLGVAAGGGGGGVSVTVNVQNAPAGVQSQASRVDSNGNVSVDVILKKPVNSVLTDSLANGDGRRLLERKFGIKPFTGR
jgi:phage-related minor tail protein